ncbi:MAG: ATP-binding protein [Planctomycetota bacterium]
MEDDPIHVEIVDFHLRRIAGGAFDVTVLARFEDAVEHLRSNATDFVLLDLTLPDSELEETLERIPELVERGPLVVAMSSLDGPEIGESARDHGASAFLAKSSITPERLARCFDVDAAPAGPGAARSVPGGEPPSRGPSARGPSAGGPSAGGPSAAPDRPESARLVSKLAHDASSWLTNQTFRLAAMEASLDDIDRDALAAHVRSLRSSAEALAALIDGARSVAEDELTHLEVEPIDVSAWLAHREIAGPSRAIRVHASEIGLGRVFEALARNAAQHGAADGPRLRVVEGDADGDAGTVDVVDDGGPWDVEEPGRLPDPLVTGASEGARAGLGLYRARRWMERMGGNLTIVERSDAPGAYAVRLRFRAAPATGP